MNTERSIFFEKKTIFSFLRNKSFIYEIFDVKYLNLLTTT